MSKPLLVIVASAPTMAELRRRRDAAALAGADLVELRLDSVADPDVTAALAGRTVPVIATCRPEWEGGAFKDSEAERRRILECPSPRREYVDVDSRRFSRPIECGHRRQADCAVVTISKVCRPL